MPLLTVLRWTEKSPTGKEIPFLLLRVDDWVDSVRSGSQRRIAAEDDRPDHCSIYLRCLPLCHSGCKKRSRSRGGRRVSRHQAPAPKRPRGSDGSRRDAGGRRFRHHLFRPTRPGRGDHQHGRRVVPAARQTDTHARPTSAFPPSRIQAASWIARQAGSRPGTPRREILPALLKDRLERIKSIAIG